MTDKLKQIIIAVVVIVLAYFGYNYFFGNQDNSSATLSSQSGTVAVVADGKQIYDMLMRLKDVKLDPSLFNNPVFEGLNDSGAVIEPEPKFRDNPFAPIGLDQASSNSTSTRR